MKIYRQARDLPAARLLRGLAGLAAMPLAPSLARGVREHPFSREWGQLGKLIRNGFLVRAVSDQDHELIHEFMCDYWASPRSKDFFDNFEHRFETVFLRHHAGVVTHLKRIVPNEGDVCLVEIGVGDGRLLEYLGGKLPSISKLHGIDLNAEQICKNQTRLRDDSRFEFHQSDALAWLRSSRSGFTLLFTNGGVFEYFRRDQLVELFTCLLDRGGSCAVALTETIGINHDLGDPRSHPYGHELSFSHNYPEILRETGFDPVILGDRRTVSGEEHHPARWLQLIATPADQRPAHSSCSN